MEHDMFIAPVALHHERSHAATWFRTARIQELERNTPEIRPWPAAGRRRPAARQQRAGAKDAAQKTNKRQDEQGESGSFTTNLLLPPRTEHIEESF
jgi:hypothetical protein